MSLNNFEKMSSLFDKMTLNENKGTTVNVLHTEVSKNNKKYVIFKEQNNKIFIGREVDDKINYYYGDAQPFKSKVSSLKEGIKQISLLIAEDNRYVLSEPLADEMMDDGSSDMDINDMDDDSEIETNDMESDENGDDVEGINSLASKLGYEISQLEDSETYSDDVKGAIKSVLSRVSLSLFTDEDKSDIINYMNEFINNESSEEDDNQDEDGENQEDVQEDIHFNDETAYDRIANDYINSDDINDYNQYEKVLAIDNPKRLDKELLLDLDSENFEKVLSSLQPLISHDNTDDEDNRYPVNISDDYDVSYRDDKNGYLLTFKQNPFMLDVYFDRNLYENTDWWDEDNYDDTKYKQTSDNNNSELDTLAKKFLADDIHDMEMDYEDYEEKRERNRMEDEPDYRYYGKIRDDDEDEEYEDDEYEEGYNPFSFLDEIEKQIS